MFLRGIERKIHQLNPLCRSIMKIVLAIFKKGPSHPSYKKLISHRLYEKVMKLTARIDNFTEEELEILR